MLEASQLLGKSEMDMEGGQYLPAGQRKKLMSMVKNLLLFV